MAALITVSELADHLQRSIEADNASALAAIADATADISNYIRRDATTLAAAGVPTWRIDAAKGVCKRLAARILLNPEGRQSFSGPEGLNFQAVAGIPARILTDDEREQLAPLVDLSDLYG